MMKMQENTLKILTEIHYSQAEIPAPVQNPIIQMLMSAETLTSTIKMALHKERMTGL